MRIQIQTKSLFMVSQIINSNVRITFRPICFQYSWSLTKFGGKLMMWFLLNVYWVRKVVIVRYSPLNLQTDFLFFPFPFFSGSGKSRCQPKKKNSWRQCGCKNSPSVRESEKTFTKSIMLPASSQMSSDFKQTYVKAGSGALGQR